MTNHRRARVGSSAKYAKAKRVAVYGSIIRLLSDAELESMHAHIDRIRDGRAIAVYGPRRVAAFSI